MSIKHVSVGVRSSLTYRRLAIGSACLNKSTFVARVAHEASATSASNGPQTTPVYSLFSDNASGEWEGITVTFNSEGAATPLPEYYVPQAFRDWGVELFDWQSHCTTLATSSGVRMAVKRLMPTVGCEADAVAFVEDTSDMFQDYLQRSQLPPVLPDGSYSYGPSSIAKDDNRMVVEACLAGQGAGRVRLVQHLMKNWQDGRWFLSKVDVHNEKFDSPYAAGRDIRSCGYNMENISQAPRADIEQVKGSWVAESGARYNYQDESVKEEVVQGHSLLPATLGAAASLMGLPLGAFSWVSYEGEDIWVVAGLLAADQSSRVLSASKYSAGSLVEVVMGREAKQVTH